MSSKLDVIPPSMAAESQTLPGSVVQRSGRNPKGPDVLWAMINLAERAAAATLLLALFPFLLLIGLTIAVLSRRSPLVRHSRVGQYGRELRILKFRTMWGSSEAVGERFYLVEPVKECGALQVKMQVDPRVTSRFASFCRKHSIDELPQLWHVLRGDMALIGPRPQTATEIRKYYGPHAMRLLSVKPGLSGLWQVTGRSRVNREQRRKLDLFMVDNWSIRLYLHIVNETIPTVLSGRDAW